MKPSVHSLGTEAARACSALGLEAECATPKHLETPVPGPLRWHAFRTRCARDSGEPLGFREKEHTCTGTGAHRPALTRSSLWAQVELPVLPGAAMLQATSQV